MIVQALVASCGELALTEFVNVYLTTFCLMTTHKFYAINKTAEIEHKSRLNLILAGSRLDQTE